MLGQYLNIELSGKHGILTQYRSNPGNCGGFNNVQLSITDNDKLEKLFSAFKPDVVVHTAAVSNAEKADNLPADLVYEINVNATAAIAKLCSVYNSKLVYLSTDLVYAGYRGSMLGEDAKLIPVSLYAETKLMGEIKIQEIFSNYIILRESLLIGIGLNHSRNNFHLMFDRLSNEEPVELFTDQFRTPIALHEAARMISQLIDKNVSREIINFGGEERISRYELGELLCEEAGFDKRLLHGKTMDDSKVVYKVADVSLSTEKLQSYGIRSGGCRNSVKEILNGMKNR